MRSTLAEKKMLKERLEILKKQMQLRLDEIRVQHQHSGNKGTNVEEIIRQFLREFLPPYFRIGNGEVIDRSGAISRQIDVVVTNADHPFVNDLSNPTTFFIEGIAMAGEVKSVLTSDELEAALKVARSFKALSLKIPNGAMVVSNDEDIKRFVERRPFFIFAFESQLTTETVKQKIEEFNATNSVPFDHQIDGVFLLDRVSIINFGNGKGAFQFRTPEGKSLAGYIYQKPGTENVLFTFLSWVSATIPKVSLPSQPILHYLVKDWAEKEDSTADSG